MPEESIFSKKVDPFLQAGYVFLGILFFTFLFKLMNWIGVTQWQSYLPWSMSAAGLLFFGIFNSVMSLAFQNQNKYWFKSIIAYACLMLFGGLFSYLLSGQSLGETMSFRWLYIVFTIGYIAFLSIVRFVRKIILIAKKQDKRLRGEE